MASTILDEQVYSGGVLHTLAVVLFLLVRAPTEDEDVVIAITVIYYQTLCVYVLVRCSMFSFCRQCKAAMKG